MELCQAKRFRGTTHLDAKCVLNDDTINDIFTHQFQVYIAEVECDVSVATSRNIHGWSEASIKELSMEWDSTPEHFNKLDLRGF